MTWQVHFDTNFNKIACNTQNQFSTRTLSTFETCFWHVRITCYILKFFMQTHKFNATRRTLFSCIVTSNLKLTTRNFSYIIALCFILVSKQKKFYFISTCCNFVLITVLFLVQESSWIQVDKKSHWGIQKVLQSSWNLFCFLQNVFIWMSFNLVG